jgi:hypothetical protein
MHIFILGKDRSVEAQDSFSEHPRYIHINYPNGQIFCLQAINASTYWRCLHRDHRGNGPAWVYTEKVPEEVLLAEMIVN